MLKRINNLKNLEITSYPDKRFKEYWEFFLQNYNQYTYRYDYDYINCEKSAIEFSAIDESFVIHKDNTPLCICPLIINLDEKFACYRNFRPLPSPLFNELLEKKQQNDLEKFLFEIIRKIFEKYRILRWYLSLDPLSHKADYYFETFGDKINAVDMPYNIRILKLEKSKDYIWGQIRNSYKNIINQSLKVIQFKSYDSKNFNDEIGKKFILLHEKCSGKITRPIKSFITMNELIKKDKAIMFEQNIEDKTAQMELVLFGKKTAVGGSMADDPDLNFKLPLSHSMNFFIFNELANKNINFYEIGMANYNSNIFLSFSEKELNIMKFKRGFGKENQYFRRWVWFENKDEEFKFYNEKMDQYKKMHKC
jgi:hypothetical protein